MYINTMTFTDQRVHCGTWTVATDTPLTKRDAIKFAVSKGLMMAERYELAITSMPAGELEKAKQTQHQTVEFTTKDILNLYVPSGEYHNDTTVRQLIVTEALDVALAGLSASVVLTFPEEGRVVASVEW